MLIATKNPCPCGYYGDATKECTCSTNQFLTYQKRVSGPLLDRIDLSITVSRVPEKAFLDKSNQESLSPQLQRDVSQARSRQHARNGASLSNAQLSSKQLLKHALLTDEAKELLTTASEKLSLSARSYFKVIRVARTIADLDDNESIEPRHVAEALQYRMDTKKTPAWA